MALVESGSFELIMSSRVYQLSSKKNDFNADDEIYASHATPRLLSAEQLLDAICQVTDVAESFKGLPAGTRAVALPDPPTDHYFPESVRSASTRDGLPM